MVFITLLWPFAKAVTEGDLSSFSFPGDCQVLFISLHCSSLNSKVYIATSTVIEKNVELLYAIEVDS